MGGGGGGAAINTWGGGGGGGGGGGLKSIHGECMGDLKCCPKIPVKGFI